MFNKILFSTAVIAFCLLASCRNSSNQSLAINFSKDSATIVITNINDAGLFQLKNNLETDSSYQNLVSVLQTPADNDSTTMEMELDGKLSLIGNKLVFTPKQPFIEGKTYMVETIINTQFASGEDIIKSDVGYKVKSEQRILKR